MQLFIGAGKQHGIRPGDLVGAIVNEAGLKGSDIGAIDVGAKHSLVEIPEAVSPRVLYALRNTTVRGRTVTVRLAEAEPSRPVGPRRSAPRRTTGGTAPRSSRPTSGDRGRGR